MRTDPAVKLTRRGLFGAMGAALLALAARPLASQGADSLEARRRAAGKLGDPSVAGRARVPTSQADNDAEIQAIEKRLKCTCGCTLDIYTCRTTDFTCTYSPELHREVVALYDEGKSADEILAAFVAKYGEEALMAPEPEGFNLAGYLVPGVVVTGLGATLLWVLSRRNRMARAAAGAAPAATGAAVAPDLGDVTSDELEALERELAEDA